MPVTASLNVRSVCLMFPDTIEVRGRLYLAPMPLMTMNLLGPWSSVTKWKTVRRLLHETLEDLQERCENMVAGAEVRSATWSH